MCRFYKDVQYIAENMRKEIQMCLFNNRRQKKKTTLDL